MMRRPRFKILDVAIAVLLLATVLPGGARPGAALGPPVMEYPAGGAPTELQRTPEGPSAQAVTLELVGQIGGGIGGVAVVGQYAYAGVGPRLVVLDVSDPASPVVVGRTDVLGGLVSGVAVEGSYALVAGGEGGLRVIDISEPSRPREVGFFDTPGNSSDVVVVGRHAIVADFLAGVRVIDVSNPSSPREVGFYDTAGAASSLVVTGGHVYVADEAGGLVILGITGLPAPRTIQMSSLYLDVTASAGGTTVSLGRPVEVGSASLQEDQPLPAGTISYSGSAAGTSFVAALTLALTSFDPFTLALQRFRLGVPGGPSVEVTDIGSVEIGVPGTTSFSRSATTSVAGLGDVTFTFSGQAVTVAP